MPDTLCRRCGGELESRVYCPECRHSIQMMCTTCSRSTKVQFHSQCMHGDVLCNTIAALA
ncbi:MAG: hypothetical protein COW27_01665 [Nitrosopumilales archaeon CG15_BIG_FIL_POST_REV_8_21_14_020_37_12]|nr:MAG: hypothetical protein COW27_01665 [Nitrosopumilales archaeon CG15_BIG_FIL_POST_REV_8_21_14_020_37_12]